MGAMALAGSCCRFVASWACTHGTNHSQAAKQLLSKVSMQLPASYISAHITHGALDVDESQHKLFGKIVYEELPKRPTVYKNEGLYEEFRQEILYEPYICSNDP